MFSAQAVWLSTPCSGPPALTPRLSYLLTQSLFLPQPRTPEKTWCPILIVGLDTLIPSTSSSLYCGAKATNQNHSCPKGSAVLTRDILGLLVSAQAWSASNCNPAKTQHDPISSHMTESQGHGGSLEDRRAPSQSPRPRHPARCWFPLVPALSGFVWGY